MCVRFLGHLLVQTFLALIYLFTTVILSGLHQIKLRTRDTMYLQALLTHAQMFLFNNPHNVFRLAWSRDLVFSLTYRLQTV